VQPVGKDSWFCELPVQLNVNRFPYKDFFQVLKECIYIGTNHLILRQHYKDVHLVHSFLDVSK